MAKSSTLPPSELLEWFREKAIDLTPEGKIQRIELWHAVDGDAGERLTVIDMNDRDEDEDPDDLCQEVWYHAETDAKTRPQGTLQRYVVQGFRGENVTAEETRAFVVQGRAVSHMLGANTEPPTERGNVAMTMRHTNDLHAMVMNLCSSMAGTLGCQLDKERRENDMLRGKTLKLLELQEDLLDRQEERNARRRAETRAEQRWDAMLQTAQQLMPVLATKLLQSPASKSSPGAQKQDHHSMNAVAAEAAEQTLVKASGGPVRTASALARDRGMMTLIETLHPVQVQHIMGALDEQQTAAFLEIYSSIRQELEAQQAENCEAKPAPAGAASATDN